jgi:hypothetical protein
MIIGRNANGKITTKTAGGLRVVNCACCEPPPLCCMYAATSAASADLPAAITLPGVGSLSKSGTNYGNTTNGVILESGVWARYVGGVRSTHPCLITGDGNLTPGDDTVEDQFADTYTVSAALASPEPDIRTDDHIRQVPRLSLCSWSYSGEQETPGDFQFVLNVIFEPTLQKWVATYVLDLDNFGAAYYIKDGPQNTPVGTYTLDSFFDFGTDNPDEGMGWERRYDYTGTFTVSEA